MLPPSAFDTLGDMIDKYGYDAVMSAGRDHMMRSGQRLPLSIRSNGGIKVQRFIRFLETAHPEAKVYVHKDYSRVVKAALDAAPYALGSDPIIMLYGADDV